MIKNLLLSSLLIFCLTTLHAQTTILDFESAATSTNFQYFGSTLEATLNNVIANPDASGINTSAMVADHVKPMGAEVWAGGFSEPNPMTPIDLTSDNQICLKVWVNDPGNLLLKLEQSSNGFADWENLQEINDAQTWVEICYDALQADASDNSNPPAAGGIYNRMVLFFDFGTSPDADRTYYFDDVVTKMNQVAPADVTFAVDMNNYTGSFTTAYVSGTFNEWSADANPLADADGDGVWTGTVTGVTAGAIEYKFQLDGWTAQEDFGDADYTCTLTTDEFTNRVTSISETTTLPTVCYNSCYACGQGIRITVNLGEGGITVSDDGLFVAGGGNFGTPGEYPLADADGDGVHSAIFERETGFESFYTFTNGACPDWSCKENIAGQDCANPDNFNDRKMGPLTADTTINTCFEVCTDDTDCMVSTGNITFEVDLSGYTDAFTTAYVSGNINGWSADANPLTDNGNGIWSTTVPNVIYGNQEYKFQLDGWAVQEDFDGTESCVVTDPTGQFINRVVEVAADEVNVCFKWNTCDACTVGVDNVDNSISTIQPTLVTDKTTIIFGNTFTARKEIRLFNTLGQNVCTNLLASGIMQYDIEVGHLPNGIYFINIQTENKQQTQRIIVSH